MPCPPSPIHPLVIRSDGATDSPNPSAWAGTNAGTAIVAAAAFRKLRRVEICLPDIVRAPGRLNG